MTFLNPELMNRVYASNCFLAGKDNVALGSNCIIIGEELVGGEGCIRVDPDFLDIKTAVHLLHHARMIAIRSHEKNVVRHEVWAKAERVAKDFLVETPALKPLVKKGLVPFEDKTFSGGKYFFTLKPFPSVDRCQVHFRIEPHQERIREMTSSLNWQELEEIGFRALRGFLSDFASRNSFDGIGLPSFFFELLPPHRP